MAGDRSQVPSMRPLLAFVCALVLVDTIFFSALTPLLPHYARAAGLTKAGVGVLVACYPAGTLIGSLPAGVLCARLGDRRVALLGLASQAHDCYYATLSSTDGSLGSIISNGNFDGPETISLSGVYAFQVNGPRAWVLVP
ncbi:MAG: MFS transporter [Trebonia sp.]|jgi:MFS family permease